MPSTPFALVIWPAGAQPLASNAEIVLVSNVTGDVLTIERQFESTSARTVVVGDQISAAVTAGSMRSALPSGSEGDVQFYSPDDGGSFGGIPDLRFDANDEEWDEFNLKMKAGSVLRMFLPTAGLEIWNQADAFGIFVTAPSITANRAQVLPDKDGTFAMLSDIPAPVELAMDPDIKTATYNLVDGDRGHLIRMTGNSAANIALTSTLTAATAGEGWYCYYENASTGTSAADKKMVFTPTTSTVDGLSSIADYPGAIRKLYSDGTNWKTILLHGGALEVLSSDSPFSFVWPSGYASLQVDAYGGGGGGGGGYAANANNVRGGGGAGGGGKRTSRSFSANDVAANTSTTCTIAAQTGSANGGTTAGGGAGANGTAGNNTTFGSFITAYGGGFGSGAPINNGGGAGGGGGLTSKGSNSNATATGGRGGDVFGVNGPNAGVSSASDAGGGGGSSGAAGGSSAMGGGGGGAGHSTTVGGDGGSATRSAGGGGGGGPVTGGNSAQNGGAGGGCGPGVTAAGSGGAAGVGGATPGAGGAGTPNSEFDVGGMGGGGGGGNSAGTGGAGGDGAVPGGGGGGGGGGTGATGGGAGGRGAAGAIRIRYWP